MNSILLLAAFITSQTVNLEKGWNAVLLEVTPTGDASPAAVFAEPVTRAGCYLPDAYERTSSYSLDGERLENRPLSYYGWNRADAAAGDLAAVAGGCVYLLYAESACSFTVRGDPALPRFFWRTADKAGSGYANFAAPSIDAATAGLYPKDYFAEGPFGAAGTAYSVQGTGETPVLLPFFATGKLVAGKAYGLTATRDGVWPGVIDVGRVGPNGIRFGADNPTASFQVRNAGTKARRISFALKPAAEGHLPVPLEGLPTNAVSVAAGETLTITVASDPTKRTTEGDYAGFIEVRDVDGGTGMRVRFPVRADRAGTGGGWPKGFFVGEFTLDRVGTNGVATTAGGRVKGLLICRRDGTGTPHLEQRLVFGADTNGTRIVKRDLADGDRNLRRISSVLLDPNNPEVSGAVSGKTYTFAWTVAEDSPVNPYRHAWHPDHDGLTYDANGNAAKTPSGDNFMNYANAVKPEIFSIGNEVKLDFDNFDWNAAETLGGTIRWTLKNLRANCGDILCTGTFSLTRISTETEWSE